ncbi:hypothetical protein DVB69_07695 [Sporosarcina sp. BI001-red]|nr:hypothetical protein DVB69_07695 [Sporosarcina sp. BI001-red]
MQPSKDESEKNFEEKRELGRPAEFFANGGNKAENATSVILGQYCWSENGESCSVEPDDPQDMMADSITGKVKPGGQLSFSVAINPSWTWLSKTVSILGRAPRSISPNSSKAVKRIMKMSVIALICRRNPGCISTLRP